MDESASGGKISLGLSVIVRVTLRDGTYHEVRTGKRWWWWGYQSIRVGEKPFCADKERFFAGYWVWAHRELQGEGCRVREGQEGRDDRRPEEGAAQLWQRAGKLHLRQGLPCQSHQSEMCSGASFDETNPSLHSWLASSADEWWEVSSTDYCGRL